MPRIRHFFWQCKFSHNQGRWSVVFVSGTVCPSKQRGHRPSFDFDKIFAVKSDLKSSTKTEAAGHPSVAMTRFGDDAKLWCLRPLGPTERNGTKCRPLQHMRYILIIFALLQSMLLSIWGSSPGETRSVSTNDGLFKRLRASVSFGILRRHAFHGLTFTRKPFFERTTRYQHRLMNLGLKPPARC